MDGAAVPFTRMASWRVQKHLLQLQLFSFDVNNYSSY